MDNWFSALYRQFILRDVLGKAIPGGILLGTIVLCVYPTVDIVGWVDTIPIALWLLSAALSWFVGLAVQAFGQWTTLIRYFPKGEPLSVSDKKRLKALNHPSYPAMSLYFERAVLLQEACGNAYVSILLATVYFVGYQLSQQRVGFFPLTGSTKMALALLPLVGFVALCLRRFHVVQVKRSDDLTCAILEIDGSSLIRRSREDENSN